METTGALSIYNPNGVNYNETQNTTSISNRTLADWKVKIFPNPFSEEIKISISLENKNNLSLGIYDLNGRELRSKHFKGIFQADWEVEMMDFPAGIYLLRITDGRSQLSQKLIKY